MANIFSNTPEVPRSPEMEGHPSSGIAQVANQIRGVLESYAAAAADARLISLAGHTVSEGTRRHRLYQQSYRPGAWGDPL
ncbi:MAG: hypothetical protein U1E67_12490 [Hyphomicrobiales bacterium]